MRLERRRRRGSPRCRCKARRRPEPGHTRARGARTTLVLGPDSLGQRDVACATCHHPDFGYSDGLDLSIGTNGAGLGAARTFVPGQPARLVKRNSQTVLNVAFNGLTSGADAAPAAAPMFWDLRVRSLEAQALEPIKALEEMRGDAYPEHRAVPLAVARLNAIAGYRELFARAFGGTRPVNEQNLGRALAAFQRTLIAVNSPFDRYMRGDTNALSPEELRGMERFDPPAASTATAARCSPTSPFTCWRARQPEAAGIGLRGEQGVRLPHALAAQPHRDGSLHAQRRVLELPEVIEFYQRVSRGGGRRGGQGGPRGLNAQVGPDQIDPLARRLNMRGRGQGDLIAFLRALDDPGFERTVPERVPSGLSVGGTLVR